MPRRMIAVRLRHVHKARHRDGRPRYLLRIPGCSAVTLPGEPGSPEFMAAYQRAVDAAGPRIAGKMAPGSLDALAASYYQSSAYAALGAPTARNYRRLIEGLRATYGPRPIRLLEPRHVVAIVAEKAATPHAAGHRLRMIRHLMAHAMDLGWIKADPTAGVRRIKPRRTTGHPTWSEEDIAAFEAAYPSGTRERLALALLLYTGQRRGDVVRMGLQHIRDARIDRATVKVIEVRQEKTRNTLLLPIHPRLAEEIEQAPRDLLPFLRTSYGRPFTSGGFYNWFRERCADASIRAGLSPHGLRKAAGVRLAEAGASELQICAILGVTPRTAAIYTAAARQSVMAAAGMARIG